MADQHHPQESSADADGPAAREAQGLLPLSEEVKLVRAEVHTHDGVGATSAPATRRPTADAAV